MKIFAPSKIREELITTIEDDLPENLDKERAFTLANSFLEKIEILDQKGFEAWKKAYSLLVERDKDDIPFLALAISLNVHGIISRDKDFEGQNEIKVWKLGECGKVALTVSRGAFSLYILDIGFNKILRTLIKWFFIFFQSFLEVCYEVYISIKHAFGYIAKKYSNLPKWAKITIPIVSIVIPSLILVFSEKSRKKLKNFLINLKMGLKDLSKRIYYEIKHNIEIIKRVIIELTPFFELSIEGIGYLIYSAYLLLDHINMLNNREKL